jgi:hypothetical protein
MIKLNRNETLFKKPPSLNYEGTSSLRPLRLTCGL